MAQATPTPSADPFFTGLDNTKPYFKAAFEGFAGCGKTYTAAKLAIGLHKRIGSKLPVVIFDTESAAKFLKPMFAEAGIQVLLRSSRSFADLKTTMQKMRTDKISDILLIDSITHVWENVLQSYMDSKRRTRLEFQDWGIIKPMWKREFSEPFVNDQYHVIMTGRAGFEYNTEKNEETGKREIFKSGVKMKVEGETAYEPDVLVLMERFEEVLPGDKKAIWREATVLKDRSDLIDGKTFRDPTFEDFAPAIDMMLQNPVARDANVVQEGDTALMFPDEENRVQWRRERDKAVEELEGLLDRIAPGSTGKDKQLKADLKEFAFGTASDTAIADLKPEVIREGYTRIGNEAVKRGIAVIMQIDGKNRLVSKTYLESQMSPQDAPAAPQDKAQDAPADVGAPPQEEKPKRARKGKAEPEEQMSVSAAEDAAKASGDGM